MSSIGTKKYFNKVSKQWDSIYIKENKLKYYFNNLIRKGLYKRFEFTLKHCENLQNSTILDIGCGTGRYSIELAKRGAKKVIGIDFAPEMISYSQKLAEKMGVGNQCEFICGDINDIAFNEKFDYVLALGFFDYIENPENIFIKINHLLHKKFIASFPRFTPIWGTQRHIRYYWIRKCPIFNYTEDGLAKLYSETCFVNHKIMSDKRGFLVVAKTGKSGIDETDS
jgi:ubiquinone/menaquinone biosynthesis C-methylase UbiE